MIPDYLYYESIRGQRAAPNNVIEMPPRITESDVSIGIITRYFARPANITSGEIYEIDATTYSRLSTGSTFRVISLLWKIKGSLEDHNTLTDDGSVVKLYVGVLTANRNIIQQNEHRMLGLKDKLTDYQQYWIGY